MELKANHTYQSNKMTQVVLTPDQREKKCQELLLYSATLRPDNQKQWASFVAEMSGITSEMIAQAATAEDVKKTVVDAGNTVTQKVVKEGKRTREKVNQHTTVTANQLLEQFTAVTDKHCAEMKVELHQQMALGQEYMAAALEKQALVMQADLQQQLAARTKKTQRQECD